MPTLPEISYWELLNLLPAFLSELRGEDSPIIVGKTRSGRSFTVHHQPGHRVYPEKLAKILRYAAISRDEFWGWYGG